MTEIRGFDNIDYSDWIIFKMIVKIYGEDKLIGTLQKIKMAGGIKNFKTRT